MTSEDARRVIVAALDAATYQEDNPVLDVSVGYDAVFVRMVDDTTWRLTLDEDR